MQHLFTVLTNGRFLVVVNNERVRNTQAQATLALHPRHVVDAAGPRLATEAARLSSGRRGGREQRRPINLHRPQLHCRPSFTLLPLKTRTTDSLAALRKTTNKTTTTTRLTILQVL